MEYKIIEQEVRGVKVKRKYVDNFVVTEVEPNFDEPQESMYAVVLSSLITDKRFTPTEKIIILEISALSRKNGYCYATKGYIAKATNTSITSVERALRKMEKVQMIDRVYTNKLIDKDRKEHIGTYQRIYWKQQPFEEGIDQNDIGGVCQNDIGGVCQNDIHKTVYNNRVKNKYICSFDNFWKQYPKKVGKKKCEVTYKRIMTNKKKEDELMAGLEKYLKKWKTEKTDVKYIPNPSTWLNGERWEDEVVISNEQYNQNARKFEQDMRVKKEKEKETYNKYQVEDNDGNLVDLKEFMKNRLNLNQ